MGKAGQFIKILFNMSKIHFFFANGEKKSLISGRFGGEKSLMASM